MGLNRGLIDKIITPVTFLFFVMNIIFLILGITAVSLGTITLLDSNILDTFTMLDQSGTLNDVKVAGLVKYVSIGLLGIGSALLVIGFMGCCGVASGVGFCIYLYSVILFLMVLGQLAGLGYVYLNKDSLIGQLKKTLSDGVNRYQGEVPSKATVSEKAINLLQKRFECCGVNGGEDYSNSPWFFSDRRSRGELVPISCCKMKDMSNNVPTDSLCQYKSISSRNPYTATGCQDVVVTFFLKRGVIVVIVFSSIMICQLFAICYAVIIERSFSDDDVAAQLIANPVGV